MGNIFNIILTTSIYASIVGLVIVFLKSLLRNKLNAKWHYIIWIVLILKLLVPFGPESTFSLFNAVPEVNYRIISEFDNNTAYLNQDHITTNQVMPSGESLNNGINQVKPLSLRENILPYAWVAGALLMLLWLTISYLVLYRKIQKASTESDERILKVYEACKVKIGVGRNIPILMQDVVGMPSIFGVFRPQVLLSPTVTKLSDKELEYILMHELSHYKRKDIFVNYLLLSLQIVHWFNPIIWYCFNQIRLDMELATDELVLSKLQEIEHRDYGRALITMLEGFSTSKLAPRLLAMADDKKNIEKRLKMIKMADAFKGKRKFVIIVGLLCIALLSGILLTNGIKKQDNGSLAGTPYNAEELIEYKTPYVGDNSKVINLVNKLTYGDSIKEVLLQTKVPYYGVIVEYDFKDLKYDKEKLRNSFEGNATIMFALIDNVDRIIIKGEGMSEPVEFTYLREEVQKKYNIDLREYSKDANRLGQLLESLIFRVSVFPINYALTMSSTPGINLSAFYYGTENVEKVRFSTESGALFGWDITTGKISKGKQTVELPYGKGSYWSPISEKSENPRINDSIITVEFLDRSGKVLGEKQVIITTNDFLNYTIKSALSDIQSKLPQSIDEAVSRAIKSRATSYKTGEVATEGHIIFDIEDTDSTIKVYTISSIGNFGFENGIFTIISGSGVVPTLITLSKVESNKYEVLEYKEYEITESSGYTDLVKEMFQEVSLNVQKYSTDFASQQVAQAEAYLNSIGIIAKISTSPVDKVLLNINVDASNKLLELASYNGYPYWIGTIEQIEGGTRYRYETSQSKTSDGYDLVTFKKFDITGNVIKEIKYKIVGGEPQLIE